MEGLLDADKWRVKLLLINKINLNSFRQFFFFFFVTISSYTNTVVIVLGLGLFLDKPAHRRRRTTSLGIVYTDE